MKNFRRQAPGTGGIGVAITLEASGTRRTLKLDQQVDINCAAELKRRLLEMISSKKELRCDLSGVVDLDVTAVQLLWAAKREAEKSGIYFVLVEPLPEIVACTLQEAGFQDLLPTTSVAANSTASSTVSANAR